MLRLLPAEAACSEQVQARFPEAGHSHASAYLPEQVAIASLAAARSFARADRHPCPVLEGLYIGSVGAARNKQGLQKAGIRCVLNASPVVPCFHRTCFQYKTISVYDDHEEDIAQHFPEAINFIDQGRRKGGVLVHCYAGRSRSAALILAYLIASEGMSLSSAHQLLRRARPAADPNCGFLRQLHAFSQALASRQQPMGRPHEPCLAGAPAAC